MANNDKESKNEIDDYRDCITFKNKAMRRGKPHQQIYRPGSGPLRKSVNEMEENDVNPKHRHMNETSYDFKSNRKRDDDRNHDSENLNSSGYAGMDSRRRHKKPEQPIYVPKPVAQAMAERDGQHMSTNDKASSISMTNLNKNYNFEADHHRNHRKTDQRNGNMGHYNNGSNNSYSKSKRFSANRRLGLEHLEHDAESRGDRRHGGRNRDRDTRQASEPRILGPQSNMNNRVRDTRSVEPAGGNSVVMHNYEANKIQAKPPSGRRHSTICLETGKPHKPIPNLDSLPPRFRRKYLQENNIDPSAYPGVLDDTWDGSSVTFQGSDNSQRPPHAFSQQNLSYQQMENRSSGPVPSYVNNAFLSHHENNMTSQQHQQQQPPPPVWSYTIPDARNRGRGRFRPDTPEQFVNPMMRSLTPDRAIILSPSNSRPCTPPPFAHKNKSLDNINTIDSSNRARTPVPDNKINVNVGRVAELPENDTVSIQKQMSSPTPISPSTKTANHPVQEGPTEILDWSEEVELNERLEAEALSDSMTRCSSVASLVENASHPQQNTHKSRKNRRNRGNRNRSSSRNSKRDRSADNQNRNEIDSNHNKQHQNRKNKQASSNSELSHSRENIDKDGFRVPESNSRNRRRKNSFRDKSNERRRSDRRDRDRDNDNSRNSSLDRSRRNSCNEVENWREEIRLRCSSEKKVEEGVVQCDNNKPKPGIIILPQAPPVDRYKPPVLNLPESMSRSRPMPARPKASPTAGQQRTLYDPNNPNKPIIVTTSNSRIPNIETVQPDVAHAHNNIEITNAAAQYTTDQYGNVGPSWYDPYSDNFRLCRKQNHLLLLDIKKADFELQYIIKSGLLMHSWNNEVAVLRQFFRDSLEFLLIRDIKFCSIENVENHFWKILYYNVIEMMRKSIVNDPENKLQYKSMILSLIDEGTKYFEKLLEALEEGYDFKLDNYVGLNSLPETKGLGFRGLALVSAQKIFLFLGDLARYKENVNETSNYGKCRQWYIKAQEINPKNGRPYNQLALLAVYARRKLDAVYYYMRSLMSSNPVQSAKESLLSLFDENRKKYEQSERKRREEKAKLQMKEKESTQSTPSSLRREIWINPDGGRRLHRTTSAAKETTLDSEEEDLQSLPSIEVNKRFITSYLHVHGKLITKIGMETFQHAALQMLREFRVLLQQTPVHLSCTRFLHLLALNMFAIDSTQLKGPELEPGCRSEVQERALIVSLQMFNIILERCVDLLQIHLRQQERAEAAAASVLQMQQTQTQTEETAGNHNVSQHQQQQQQHQPIPLSQDLQVLLPAVKVWCDWMLCHSSVWNPPPSCVDYQIGPSSDAWGRLATLMNQLEKLDYSKPHLEDAPYTDNNVVRLPEDITMCGFTPLMCHFQPTVHVRKQVDMESAQMSFRINQLLFFGTEFLCGQEPPVLKLQRYDTFSEYISVVQTSSRDSPTSPPELLCNEDLLVESFSEDDEDEEKSVPSCGDAATAPGEIRTLLDRKVELERRQRTQELHRQRVQAILQQSVVSVEIEIRPRYLVPDTNCFIDYLDKLQGLARVHGPHTYTLMVPLVVLGELEGLTRGGKAPAPTPRMSLDPGHMIRVAEAARRALDFLHCRNPAVKCLTTRGTVLTSSTFTSEDEDRSQDIGPRNDDRILTTCISLCNSQYQQHQQQQQQQYENDTLGAAASGPRKIYREVVLLTDDRNLRVKALARDVPVRELPDFLQWAGLG